MVIGKLPSLVVLAGWLAAAGPAHAGLQIGDKAPPLEKVQWLKGAPVDPTSGKEVCVLEFWATWCGPCIMQIPHISELQKKYADQGVRFVGLTGADPRQRFEQVKKFMADRGAKMEYTVGFDPTEQSYNAYMAAFGINSIPHVFIVDRQARIAWHGDPGQEMEEVLKLVVAGQFSADKARERAEQRKKLEVIAAKFNFASRSRDWDKALAALGEMVEVDAANPEGIQLSLQILSQEIKDPQRLRAWVQSYVQSHGGDAAGLALVSTTLLQFQQLGDRQPDLALAAAEAACAADGKSVAALEALARALHQIGRLDEAIQSQSKAVEAAGGPAKSDAQRTLDFYRACQKLAQR